MLMMISPAKKLDVQTPAPVETYTQPDFLDRSAELVALLRMKSMDELSVLMTISEKLAQLNTERFRDWQPPFDPGNAKQALFAFRGDVYASLDADTLEADELTYAQDHLRILSGLYGLLRPLDLMQAYRLEMGTRLRGPHGRDLYAFWGESLSCVLAELLAGHQDKSLINLASNEYARAVDSVRKMVPVIDIVFKEEKDGAFRTIAIHAKRARGLMCRYAIENKVQKPQALLDFTEAGYASRAEMSSDTQWVFARSPY